MPKEEKVFEYWAVIATLGSPKKHMKPFIAIFMVLWAVYATPLFSQSGPAIARQLAGSWEGKGQLFGQPASFYMEWEQSLGGKFLGLKFRNSFTDGSGTERTMEARAYYQLDSLRGYWFDSRGQILPLTFEIDENILTVFWGDEETERGKTLYTIHPNAAEVSDHVYRNEAYVPFGTASYQKKE